MRIRHLPPASFLSLLPLAAVLLATAMSAPAECGAKIVRQRLKVEKAGTATKTKKSGKDADGEQGRQGESADSLNLLRVAADTVIARFSPRDVSFTGYDKPATSRFESFHIVNDTRSVIRRVKIRIVYKDMKGRMLHSRNVTFSCHVPPGEARKIEIKTWDVQHSFYYYLGNEPRRVASPYRVEIIPLTYWIDVVNDE